MRLKYGRESINKKGKTNIGIFRSTPHILQHRSRNIEVGCAQVVRPRKNHPQR